MEQRLNDVLSGNWGDSILPFFWQHGESKELLEEGMEKIYASGIRSVCVESRPHPDFVGEKWWKDMDIIMDKAKKLGMHVWVLDDAHFPSGYSNGKVKDNIQYGKTYLVRWGIDAAGPKKDCGFLLPLEEGEERVGVIIGKRDPKNPNILTQVRDITELVENDMVYLDIPQGVWCVQEIMTTKKGTGRPNYINSIDRESVRFFIDTVYEAHYEHYKEDFGKTFAGFFSDEPEIGNCGGEYVHNAVIGTPTMPLPWSSTVKETLKKKWREDFVCNLAALWQTVETEKTDIKSSGYSSKDPKAKETDKTAQVRAEFMSLISELYGKNFCGQIGDWCRAHGVEYIGHVIEDGGSHAHLGLGTGHFFRALWGQDMSGIDVVLQQIRPKLDDLQFYGIRGKLGYHGTFFHYALAKLGASLGHLDDKKKGRIMCEVFGAYGWSEGLKLMKWLLDHMLVNGVNYFVPHAFTMKDFPDPDCPPHFYARGMNPQFPYFKDLMEYCQRVSHLIQGGAHVPSTAVLYPAEQEWMGAYTPVEAVGMELTKNQIDFDILPLDYILRTKIKDGKLCWGSEQVKTFVIPGSKYIPKNLAEWIVEATEQGLKVFFYEETPDVLYEDGYVQSMDAFSAVAIETCKKGEIAKKLREEAAFEIETKTEEPWLRYYHYRQSEGEYWLLFNESDTDQIETEIKFSTNFDEFDETKTEYAWYDAWENKMLPCQNNSEETLSLSLSPYEMKILYRGYLPEDEKRRLDQIQKRQEAIAESGSIVLGNGADIWKVSVCEAGENSFTPVNDRITEKGMLGNFSRKNPNFSGTIRYEVNPDILIPKTKNCILDLGEVYETAHILVNGRDAGVRVAPPYRFDISEYLTKDKNTLTIEVVNTLVNRQRDFFSASMPIEPSGLIGPVTLYTEEE